MATQPSAPPLSLVRIKRKRDEPPLPAFTLGNKRPTLEQQLSLAPNVVPTAVRYRLVGAGAFADSEAQTAVRGQEARRKQNAARYRMVALHRASDAATAAAAAGGPAAPNVLELERCESAEAAASPAKPKLVPFGAPLPPTPEPAADDADPLESIWGDMAAAAAEERGEPPPAESFEAAVAASGAARAAREAKQAASEFVYDEYEVAGGAEDGADDDGGVVGPELWWEELDGEAVAELEGMWLADGDEDSQGELDYPDEESDSADSDAAERGVFR